MPNNPYQHPPGSEAPPPGYPPQGAPPPGYPPYPGAAPAGGPQWGNFKPHRASTVLLLGILGLVVCNILGIIAWVMGNADLKEMRAGTMDPSGYSTTNAGRICGIIATVFMLVGLVLGIIYFVFVVNLVTQQAMITVLP